jgi:hypothetical protein|nr:MAG TPA: protein of unknown function (DUF4083) [Caudoviricetes sp.]
MLQPIYWILAISVMLLLLVSTVYGLIDRIKTNKEFKKINKKHIEYLDKQIKMLENMESEDK